jgi:hypothetical protein
MNTTPFGADAPIWQFLLAGAMIGVCMYCPGVVWGYIKWFLELWAERGFRRALDNFSGGDAEVIVR